MQRITALFTALALTLGLCACSQSAATWQEQYDLGIRYLSEGNYREAIIAFTAAIEVDPKRADAYLNLADAYMALGDLDSALQALRNGYAATGDARFQARIEELAAPEPTPTPIPTPIPEPTPMPNLSGKISMSGNGRDMQLSLTIVDLPDEIYMTDYYNVNASFSISISDGQQTFQVCTEANGSGNESPHMEPIPQGPNCEQYLMVASLAEDGISYDGSFVLRGSVSVSRNMETITWSFSLPDAGFNFEDIKYVGYYLNYYNSNDDQVFEEATFSVEQGEINYLNSNSVEDLGFGISEEYYKSNYDSYN